MEQALSLSLYRRSHERFKIDGSATLVNSQNSEVPSILTDLSSRGAGIFSSSPLEADEKIKVIIKAPFFFTGFLRREARVAWCKRINANLTQAGLDFGLDNPVEFA